MVSLVPLSRVEVSNHERYNGEAMALSRSEVEHIAQLARVGMTEEDITLFAEQLSHILEQFQVLDQVDTTDVPPSSHTVDLTSVFRDDEVTPSSSKEDVLANAPREDEGFFRVKSVLG
ncbi:MAG: Asp-tRNA(Asn)/Glu-tRNA(Gln) amidotransferase subunit GatC [Dehalococcoidia bacterium]